MLSIASGWSHEGWTDKFFLWLFTKVIQTTRGFLQSTYKRMKNLFGCFSAEIHFSKTSKKPWVLFHRFFFFCSRTENVRKGFSSCFTKSQENGSAGPSNLPIPNKPTCLQINAHRRAHIKAFLWNNLSFSASDKTPVSFLWRKGHAKKKKKKTCGDQ